MFESFIEIQLSIRYLKYQYWNKMLFSSKRDLLNAYGIYWSNLVFFSQNLRLFWHNWVLHRSNWQNCQTLSAVVCHFCWIFDHYKSSTQNFSLPILVPWDCFIKISSDSSLWPLRYPNSPVSLIYSLEMTCMQLFIGAFLCQMIAGTVFFAYAIRLMIQRWKTGKKDKDKHQI